MGEDRVVDLSWLLNVKIPDIGPANLITEGKHLLELVKRESDEPNLTVLEANFVDDSHFVLCKFNNSITIVVSQVVKNSGLPADDCVLTTLGENKVTEPLAAVHVVTMNVSGAEVGKMTQFCGENFLGLQSHMTVGEFYSGLK